ncbi:hypothetical protein PTSG_09098 [Salpingoeca rosetta]|uniref:TNFR-Cys domain-containing protein n=1 Tax=Salpingoeca rosetta (strain ATCC 50818 / BSB-021) TaxID=946362 RepID=F2UMQ3_SALR5|nr:uncharacterized protein PTSG_09098 [Salpingoeca rosetta]EGD78402.1 hypothetical protein PTSG_09098 [Salpingoeca rosetta]|eukprot:XP_004989351.1 hypothetical protein PTSG_09098 [Salpingoeca rosetta]
MSARPADATLTSNNGRCISECPDGGHELGNGCAECQLHACAKCHTTRRHRLPPLPRQPHQSCIAHCPLNYYAKDHRCVPCTTCGMAAPFGMEYQPPPDRASCLPTSACEEPFIETIPPTLTTDCLCSCDTLTCNKLITQLFEEMVCAEPMDEQLDVVLDVCCSGQGEDGIRDTIRQMDADEARRSCTGCTDTCECSAGFILVYDADSADCRPCDSVTEFSPSIGGSRCEPTEECERGQEEVAAPTRCSSDRVCRDCPAGTIDEDSDGSAGCQPDMPRRPLHGGGLPRLLLHLHLPRRLSGQGVPCLPVTTCDAGEEETVKPTPTSDRVCGQCELGATFKPVDGQAESCRPVTQCASASLARSRSQAPTLDSDRECALECSECPSGRFEIRACSTLENDQFELFPTATPTADRICCDLTQCNPSTECERTTCATSSPSATLASSASAPTSTSNTNRASYGHYVPAGSIGSCEQFLCPAGTANLDRNASTLCTPCQVGVDFAALSLVSAIAHLWRSATLATRRSCALLCAPPSTRTTSAAAASRACSTATATWTSARADVALRAWLLCDGCAHHQHSPRVPDGPHCLSNEYELVDTQSRREAFEAALGSVIATVASLNEDITVCLFSLFVSGDITDMGSTASQCEADATSTAGIIIALDRVLSALATFTSHIFIIIPALLQPPPPTTANCSSNSKEVAIVILVGTHVLAVVGVMTGNSSCCDGRKQR